VSSRGPKARESPRDGLESSKKSRIVINGFAGNPALILAEVILMLAPNSSTDAPQALAMRAERARRIAAMLSTKDAKAIEAYAEECEAMAKRTIERQALPPLAA
jgi:hypothetical protein